MTNPSPADSKFEEVVELFMIDSEKNISSCSGIFISSTLLITAAHCFFTKEKIPVKALFYRTPDGKFHEGKFFTSDAYIPYTGTITNIKKDIGLVQFSEPLAPGIAKLAHNPVDQNEKITMVGFGDTNVITNTGSGKKTMGSNRATGFEENLIIIDGYANESSRHASKGIRGVPGGGDSGGAVFNQSSELVGIMAAGKNRASKTSHGEELASGILIDLNHPNTLQVMQEVRDNLCRGKAPQSSCEPISCSIQ